jgi:hypothetical protein
MHHLTIKGILRVVMDLHFIVIAQSTPFCFIPPGLSPGVIDISPFQGLSASSKLKLTFKIAVFNRLEQSL